MSQICKNAFLCLGLLIYSLPLIAASFTVTGLSEKASENVTSRLTELYKSDSNLQARRKHVTEQVAKALYPYGYFKPSVSLRFRGNHVYVNVRPGPQMRIASLSLKVIGEGKNNPRIQQALRDIPLKVGQPLNNKRYQESKDLLFSAADHEGFLHATFKTAEMLIDRKQYKADIVLLFDTGPQYYFGHIRFDPTYVSHKLLARFVPFHYGHPYSTDDILSLEDHLSGSGYFKSVIVKPQINGHRYVPIDVHLKPVNRTTYSFGVGYGTDTGPRGRIQYSRIPVNRAGHKFNAIVQGSAKENAALAQYLIPGRNPATDQYSITGSFSNLDYNSGTGNAALLSVAEQHIKKNHQRIISLNALNERYNYTLQPKNTSTLIFPKAALTWRRAEDPLFSPSGYNISANTLGASKAVLSDVSVAQGLVDAKMAFTFEYIRTRLFFHGIIGMTAIEDIDELPLSLSFLLGGAENLKGYSFNSIGPGKRLTYGGLEIQKETKEKWYLISFVDVGDVYNPTIMDLKYDVGVGLMWVSPVGPIKVGVAQAVNNRFQRIKNKNPKLVINMGPDL